MQKWKTDTSLHSCDVEEKNGQIIKKLDYGTTYVENFLNQDELKDWESIDRCIELWEKSIQWSGIDVTGMLVLDCGTKDCQFPEWLLNNTTIEEAIGMEISPKYVEYAKSKDRPVVYGDVCDIEFKDNTFDFVFSHHLLGLVSDYQKGLDEMFRVLKPGGYMLTLNQVPGNPKKHYSYIDSPKIFHDFIKNNECEQYYDNYIKNDYDNEWVMFIKKG